VVNFSYVTGIKIFVASPCDLTVHVQFPNVHSVCFCVMFYPKLCCMVYETNVGNVKAADNK
jgi:hypothetical protein